jgi:hypothetical protein
MDNNLMRMVVTTAAVSSGATGNIDVRCNFDIEANSPEWWKAMGIPFQSVNHSKETFIFI